MTANDGGSISSGSLHRIFGSVGASTPECDDSNHGNETTQNAPTKTEEQSHNRYRYSVECLRALRHNRRYILPENITQSQDGRRPKIPTLKPNPPTRFSTLSLPKELSTALQSLSLTTATPIQATAIPYARLGGDLVAQATSGTGKTLTYALIALDSILPSTSNKCALIIVPARELAYQVAELFTKLSGVRVVTLVGGTKENIDEERLSKPVNVVVGTPGRVEAMVTRGALNVAAVKVLVLDEADRLLDGSFGGSVERICNLLPPRQTLAFSATFSYSFKMSLLEVMREPAWIGGSQVVHSVIQLKEACYDLTGKINALKSLFHRVKFTLCVVFFNAKRAAGRVVKNLTKAFSFQTKLIHASMNQKERDAVIRDVRQQKVRVLVTTDVLARGIDFDKCDLVIHLDVPLRAETYLHRVGRAGRFGRKGSSLLMFDEGEVSAVRALEEDLGYTIGSQHVLDVERPFKPPDFQKNAADRTEPLPARSTPFFNHNRQSNKKSMQHDSHVVKEKKGETRAKEANLSAGVLEPEKGRSQCMGPHMNLKDKQEKGLPDEPEKAPSHEPGEAPPHEPEEAPPHEPEEAPPHEPEEAPPHEPEEAPPHEQEEAPPDEQEGAPADEQGASLVEPIHANESSPQQPAPVISPSSIQKTIPKQPSEQSSTPVSQRTPVELDKSLQPEDKPKELSMSRTAKRPISREEPTTPAKKRKSARAFVENLPIEALGGLWGTNKETLAKSPKHHDDASTTLKKRQHKLFEWQKSSSQQNGDRLAPDNEQRNRCPSNDAGERIDASPMYAGQKQSDSEKAAKSSRGRILEQVHRSPGPDTEAGQSIPAKERCLIDAINMDTAPVAEQLRNGGGSADHILHQQHMDDNGEMDHEDMDEEPTRKALNTESISEEYREAWDKYAKDAYDTGYREAYEEAFRMAQEVRQRLEGGLR